MSIENEEDGSNLSGNNAVDALGLAHRTVTDGEAEEGADIHCMDNMHEEDNENMVEVASEVVLERGLHYVFLG
jgi:hypothetical protein